MFENCLKQSKTAIKEKKKSRISKIIRKTKRKNQENTEHRLDVSQNKDLKTKSIQKRIISIMRKVLEKRFI